MNQEKSNQEVKIKEDSVETTKEQSKAEEVKENKKSDTKKKVKKGISIGLYGFFGAILVFLLVITGSLCVQKFIQKKPVPMFAGRATLLVVTGSMNGTINEGDLIVIKKSKDFKTGDIITFMPDGGKVPVTHRIVDIDAEGLFITKGDANPSRDTEHISKDQIIGKYVTRIKGVCVFFQWLKKEGGFIYILSGAIILGGGCYLLVSKPSKEKEKEGE